MALANFYVSTLHKAAALTLPAWRVTLRHFQAAAASQDDTTMPSTNRNVAAPATSRVPSRQALPHQGLVPQHVADRRGLDSGLGQDLEGPQ